MLNLNSYIIEKLKINKDIKIKRYKEPFKSKDEAFDYIKIACKDYGFSYEEKNYWLYVFKNKNSKFPNILFGYSDKDENGNMLKDNHDLSTLVYNSGKLEHDKVIINTDINDYELVDYPKDYDQLKYHPVPNEYNILFALDTLDKFKK